MAADQQLGKLPGLALRVSAAADRASVAADDLADPLLGEAECVASLEQGLRRDEAGVGLWLDDGRHELKASCTVLCGVRSHQMRTLQQAREVSRWPVGGALA